MELTQSFEVDAPVDRVWEALTDVARVTPCLPGASVVAHNDDGSFDGEFRVKLGPTSAAYHGRLVLQEADRDAHRATMQASGTDRRGQGAASATITSTVAPAGSGSRVEIVADYTITGRLARFGRGGTIEAISVELVAEFARNLGELLGGEVTPVSADPAPAAVEEPAPAAVPAPAPAEDVAPAEEPAPVEDPAPVTDPDAAMEGAIPIAEPQGGALTGPVARVRENPLPFTAMLLGFLVALRVLRRRS